MITLKASPAGLRKIRQVRKEKGWNLNDARWLASASAVLGVVESDKFAPGISYGTWKRFLGGKQPIEKNAFKAYCQVLGIGWQQVISPRQTSGTNCDWGEAIDVSVFFGRDRELSLLERWLVGDRSKLILLLGMGGIGKTALSIQIAQNIREQFDFVFWRSLRNAPPLNELLAEAIQFVSRKRETRLPDNLAVRIELLLKYLGQTKCLVIFDNWESILVGNSPSRTSQYRRGYAGYGRLLQAIAQNAHQSSAIVTSREQPKDLVILEAESAIRCLSVTGLQQAQGQEIFATKGSFTGTETDWQILLERYGGNPLALKIVASHIRDFFDGNIREFLAVLQQGVFIFDDIRQLLSQQFQRLSELERQIMYWLAIARRPIGITELQVNLVPSVSGRELTRALAVLQNRALIEVNRGCFSQQPVLMEYVISELIENVRTETIAAKIELFNSHALIQARTEEYIRDSQIFSILQPLIDKLIQHYGDAKAVESRLSAILETWRVQPAAGYFGGNLINLLRQLEIDLSGYDFSGLTIWQANLQGLPLHRVNFSNCDLSRSVFTETTGNILTAVFSPQGDRFATSDNTGKVRIWQTDTGKLLTICNGHTNWIRCLAFSPNGETIASGAGDLQIKLWNCSTGECLQTLEGHRDEIYSMAYSEDGQTIASGSGDRTIKLWDVRTGGCLQTLTGHRGWIRSIAIAGEILASGSTDGTIKLWNLTTGEYLQTLTGHTDWVRSVAFSPDLSSNGKRVLASSSSDSTIKLWDLTTGECRQTYRGHSHGVYAIAFSPQGDLLASGGGDTTIRLWDTVTHQCLKTLYGHTEQIVALDFAADGNTLLCTSLDRTVRLWEIGTSKCLRSIEGYTDWAFPIDFSQNWKQTMLATINSDYTINLWHPQSGDRLGTLSGHQGHIWSLAFCPERNILASSGADRQIKLWNLKKGQCYQALLGHDDWVYAVAFHPDAKTIISSGGDDTLRIWDLDTGKARIITERQVWSLAIARSGQTFVTGSRNNPVKLWDIDEGKCLLSFSEDCQGVYTVALSPNEKIIASGCGDRQIRLWDINTGSRRILRGHQGFVFALAISPDGQTLASSSCDRTVKLWNMQTGECWKTLRGHTNKVCSVKFSPDGAIVASGSQDQSARLWDIKTGKCLRVLRTTRLYEQMNITGVTGLTPAQQEILKVLGASCK